MSLYAVAEYSRSFQHDNLFVKSILAIYIFVCSWSGVVYIFSRPLHFYFLLSAFIVYLPFLYKPSVTFPKRLYFSGDVLVLLALAWLTLNTIFLPNDKSINYLLAYYYICGAGYLLLKPLLYKNMSIVTFLRVNYFAVLFVALFSLLEFSIYLFLSVNVHSFLPRIKPADATYLGFLKRSYGFANEPTNLALYFNTLGPFALYYIWYELKAIFLSKVLVSIIIVCGLLVTLSASGYFFFTFSLLLVATVRFMSKLASRATLQNLVSLAVSADSIKTRFRTPLITMLFSLVIATGVLSVFDVGSKVEKMMTPIYKKITLADADDRLTRWEKSWKEVTESPVLGAGLGSYSTSGRNSSVNWYLFLAAETGIVSVMLFAAFFVAVFVAILRSSVTMKYCYLFGFVAAIGHFATISTIQNPFLWILISIFFVDKRTSRDMVSYVLSDNDRSNDKQ